MRIRIVRFLCLLAICPFGALRAAAQQTHIVQSGETLSSIATAYNTTYLALAELNKLASPYFLYVGQSITLAPPPPAPEPVSPAQDSLFVESNLDLAWRWDTGLEASQLYALRVGAESREAVEIWTADSAVNVQRVIDSFRVDFGRYDWQVAVVNLDGAGNFRSMASEWSEIRSLQRLRRLPLEATPYEEMSPAARAFADRELSASELIDAAHLFIHQNSQTSEQLSYAADYSDAITQMFNYAKGDASEMPQLLCDGRSTAMLTLLREHGIESRLVFLYQDTPGYLNQHTVLEAFNPDTQRWQVHDVGSDFYFVDGSPTNRVSAERLLFGGHEGIRGCPIDGGACSAMVSAQSLPYFGALRYGFTDDVWVNPDRFDISDRFAAQNDYNLAEYIGDGDSRRVSLRLDSWR